MHFETIRVADQTSYDPGTGEFSAELVEPVGGWPVGFAVGAEVVAIVIDGSTSDTSEFGLATTVTATNQPAVFDTPYADFNIDENTTFVEDLDSTDPEGGQTTYSIVGGADAALFTIRVDLGILTFATAPDLSLIHI